MAIEDLYNITFSVQRLTNAQDAIGGESGTWANLSTGNIGRYRLLSGTEREYAGRQGVMSTHRLYCESSVTIIEADRVVIGSLTFDVQYIYNVDELDHHLQVDTVLRE